MNTMPGLDILQQWMQSARGAVPGLQTWASPTLDPDEIGKRIEDLRTVQFWLEQNAKLISSSIQALEVQRMTLTTLKNLNVPLADIGAAFRLPEMPEAAPERPVWPPAAAPAPAEAKADAPAAGPAGEPGAADEASGAGAAPLADPMQWWGSLTQQFATLASQAMKDSAAAAQAAAAQAAAASASTPPKPAVAKRARPASQGAGAAGKRSRSTPATASGTTGAKTRKPR